MAATVRDVAFSKRCDRRFSSRKVLNDGVRYATAFVCSSTGETPSARRRVLGPGKARDSRSRCDFLR